MSDKPVEKRLALLEERLEQLSAEIFVHRALLTRLVGDEVAEHADWRRRLANVRMSVEMTISEAEAGHDASESDRNRQLCMDFLNDYFSALADGLERGMTPRG